MTFQFSIGDAYYFRLPSYDSYETLVSILYWRCRAESQLRDIQKTLICFNSLLEMPNSKNKPNFFFYSRLVSILYWRCETEAFLGTGVAKLLGFQFSIGDALKIKKSELPQEITSFNSLLEMPEEILQMGFERAEGMFQFSIGDAVSARPLPH